jgi:hypothetical protein
MGESGAASPGRFIMLLCVRSAAARGYLSSLKVLHKIPSPAGRVFHAKARQARIFFVHGKIIW